MNAPAPEAVPARGLVLRPLIILSVLLVIVLIAGGAYAIKLVARRTETAVFVHARNLHDCDRMAEAFERKLASWRGYLLSGEASLLADRDAANSTLHEKLDALERRLRGKEAALLRAVDRASAAHDRASRDLETQRRAGEDLGEVAREWTVVGLPRAHEVRSSVDELRTSLERRHAQAEAEAASAERVGFLTLAGITLGVLLLGGIGGSVLAHAARARKKAENRMHDEIAARLTAETAARGEAEAARNFFGALLDELPVGFIAVEAPSGSVLHVSANASAILRGTTAADGDALDAHTAWQHATRADGSAYAAEDLPLARALRGETVHGEEVCTAKGRVVVCSAAPIRGESGDVVAAALAFTDATEKREAEAERELFLAALGHDLRNPLSAISLTASTMSVDKDADERTRRQGARIVNASSRMMRLIEQLLDFVKSRHGDLPINASVCDLHDIAREVIATVELGNPDAALRLERRGSGVGRWDRDRISQVLQNLIGNAVHHGEKDAPVIVRITDCGADACIEVINRGAAIPSHVLPHLFEPFRRGQTGTGLGLGLYIAHAIITAHGGTLEVESNETTTFRARLPTGAPTTSPATSNLSHTGGLAASPGS